MTDEARRTRLGGGGYSLCAVGAWVRFAAVTTSETPSTDAADEARADHLRVGAVTGPGSALAQAVRGFTMGAADIVPGVSGGTVALVLGIYEHLVATVREGALALGAFVRLDLRLGWARLRAVDWAFLLPLVAGIGLAIVGLAGPLSNLLEDEPVLMASVFVGLIAGSVVVASREVEHWDVGRVAVGLVAAVATFLLLGIRGASVEEASLLVFAGAGALAICAMILPGISGSFILVMLGMYQLVLDAVEARDALTVAAVGVGAVIGLGTFSAGLNWLLREHRDTVLAVLIGLMAGSLRVLWPWPAEEGFDDVRLGAPVAGEVVAAALAAVVSFVVVVVVASWANRAAHEDAEADVHQA